MNCFKRVMCIAAAIVCAVTCGGCWDKRELSDLAVVMGIAIDAGSGDNGETVTISAQIANAEKSGGSPEEGSGGKSYNNFTRSGGSAFEVLRGMTHLSSRQLYNSHNQIVVFGSELAEKQGVSDVIDFFMRDNEIRYSMLIAVADGKAAELFDASPEYEQVPARELAELILVQSKNSGSAVCTLLDFMSCGVSVGKAALVPLVKTVKPSSEQQQGQQESGGQQGSGEQQKSGEQQGSGGQSGEKRLEVSGSAVFDGVKMVGKLNTEETRGALWVRQGVKAGILPVETDGVTANIELFGSRCKFDVKLDKEKKASADISCAVHTNLGEIKGYVGEINGELVARLKEVCKKKIESEIRHTYDKSKDIECDVFGFGDNLYRYSFSDWLSVKDDWIAVYKDMTLNIKVSVDIDGIGEISEGIPLKNGDIAGSEENK